MIKNDCGQCDKKSFCKVPGELKPLCQKLETYLSKFDKPQRERTVGLPSYSQQIEWSSSVYLTSLERQILTLTVKKLTRQEICQICTISRTSLRFHLSNLKKKYLES